MLRISSRMSRISTNFVGVTAWRAYVGAAWPDEVDGG
jgi:hypothetical protein